MQVFPAERAMSREMWSRAVLLFLLKSRSSSNRDNVHQPPVIGRRETGQSTRFRQVEIKKVVRLAEEFEHSERRWLEVSSPF